MKNIVMATLGAVAGLGITAAAALGGYTEGSDGSYTATVSAYGMLTGSEEGDVTCSARDTWPGGCYFYNGAGNLVCYDIANALDNFKGVTPGMSIMAEWDSIRECTRLNFWEDSGNMRKYYQHLLTQNAADVTEQISDLTCTPAGTGASFECLGDCAESALALGAGMVSSNFGTNGDVWFVAEAPINGWQASNINGRTITVNGVVVSMGGPLPDPAADGKFYFHFSAGSYSYATWSYW